VNLHRRRIEEATITTINRAHERQEATGGFWEGYDGAN